MHFDPAVLVDYWPLLLQGAWLTLQVAAMALVIGYVAGIAVALIALMPGWLPRLVTGCYVEILRNIPFIIILFVVYYGLPFWGIRLPATLVGTVALALFASAYYAEIVRAAILALPRGQFESARAIGMSPMSAMWHVVAPQILRTLVPPSTNMTLTMMKESSVLSSITVPELTYQSLVVQGNTFAPFEVFAAVASIYWLIAALIAEVSRRLERRVGAVQAEATSRNRIADRYLSLVARRS
ncbi:amine acid ABC transporter, permease protein, 3-TM region, His/Glu/Gln/Arg/opine family [Bradyrhizobium sp. YR681]|uniref:amino acid ABC transporter permease n=1 Tax=Bradyrhizobium sp. YR681 TaxID=1144344 RepID=UPI00026FCB63|nr:amino acid ABC transporter permease [Bradyrhizobium sp. YR681]EJN08716.1 amine acid ABC transporter, permease protein, 3-TM region, His/Glu/Gln/Arg/opine family [Bradyrhizobium sp. YR681]